jgi:hypothetical protein
MSYIINNGPGPDSGRLRRRMLFSAVAIGVVALLVAAFLIGRQGTGPGGETGSAPPPVVSGPAVSWVRLGTQPVPVSPAHGPAETGNGLAAGFSHDELGALLAAINISARLTGQAGPAVYETTARQQCVGDIDATISAIRSQRSTAAAGSTTPTEYLYRLTSGDPRGDLVGITIALDTRQSRSFGGYTEISRTLQWIDGDWKLHVPPPPPRLITSVNGWRSLGTVPDA